MVVRNDDQARLQLLIQLQHQTQNVLAVARVEVAGRLIGQYELRSRNQRTCHGCPLAFATRQLTWLVRQALPEPDPAE